MIMLLSFSLAFAVSFFLLPLAIISLTNIAFAAVSSIVAAIPVKQIAHAVVSGILDAIADDRRRRRAGADQTTGSSRGATAQRRAPGN